MSRRPLRPSLAVAVLLAGLLAPPTAAAHPFGASTAAHRIELQLAPDQVEVRYTVAVPNPVLRANARLRPGRDPVVTTTSELVSGLMLLADGARVPLQVQGGADVQRDDDAHVLGLTFTGPLPPNTRRLELSNGNLPEVTTVSSHAVWVRPGLQVVDSSLLETRRGRLLRDDSGRWLPGPDGRQFAIQVRHRNGPSDRLVRWLIHAPTDGVPLAQALRPPRGAAFRSGPPTPDVALGFLVLATAVGGAVRARPGGFPVAIGLVAPAAAVLGYLLPAATWAPMDLTLGLLVLGLAVLSAIPAAPRDPTEDTAGVPHRSVLRASSPWLAVPILAAAAHAPRLGVAVLALSLVAWAVRLPATAYASGAILGISGGWLAVRGLLALLG